MSKAIKLVLIFTLALVIGVGSIGFSGTSVTVSAAANKKYVATLTIHSDPSQKIYGNHAFLSIKNTSKQRLNILGTYVQPDNSITVSTYPSHSVINPKIVYGAGIYTNLDAYLIKYKGEYKNRVSLSRKLTSEDLKKVLKCMSEHNKWTEFNNCAWFAVTVWDTVADYGDHLLGFNAVYIYNPVSLSNEIKKKYNYKKCAPIGNCDKSNVRKYNGPNSSKLILPRYIDSWY